MRELNVLYKRLNQTEMNTLNDSFLACYSPFITPNTPYFLHIFLNNWILNVKTDIDTGARTYLQVIP